MNERIKELAEQCHHRYSEHNIDLEKFAKLIVQKCANFIDSHEQVDKYGESMDIVYGKDLLKHFGVEE